MEAEWIDVPTATLDGVLCRFGYMLLADPETALRETRRVLKPGGRVALAVWDTIERNPWLGVVRRVMAEQGRRAAGRSRTSPARSALSAPGAVQELLENAGFADVQVEAIDLEQRAASLDDWWENLQDTSAATRNAVSGLSARGRTIGCVTPSTRGIRSTCAKTARSPSRPARWSPRPAPSALAAQTGVRLLLGGGDRRRRPGADLLPAALAGARGARRWRRSRRCCCRTPTRRSGSPTASTASCPRRSTATSCASCTGTRDNSPMLLAIALVAMLWTSSGAIGVIERCESRMLDCKRHDVVTRPDPQHPPRRRDRDHGDRRDRRRAGHRRRRRRAEHPRGAAGLAVRRAQHDRLDRALRVRLPLGAALAATVSRVHPRRGAGGHRDPGRPRVRRALLRCDRRVRRGAAVPAARGDPLRAVRDLARDARGGRDRGAQRAAQARARDDRRPARHAEALTPRRSKTVA